MSCAHIRNTRLHCILLLLNRTVIIGHFHRFASIAEPLHVEWQSGEHTRRWLAGVVRRHIDRRPWTAWSSPTNGAGASLALDKSSSATAARPGLNDRQQNAPVFNRTNCATRTQLCCVYTQLGLCARILIVTAAWISGGAFIATLNYWVHYIQFDRKAGSLGAGTLTTKTVDTYITRRARCGRAIISCRRWRRRSSRRPPRLVMAGTTRRQSKSTRRRNSNFNIISISSSSSKWCTVCQRRTCTLLDRLRCRRFIRQALVTDSYRHDRRFCLKVRRPCVISSSIISCIKPTTAAAEG